MKEIEKYTVKEAVKTLERKIKFLENKMIKEKMGATNSSGAYNYYFIVMQSLTRELLSLTKPITVESSPTEEPIDNM